MIVFVLESMVGNQAKAASKIHEGSAAQKICNGHPLNSEALELMAKLMPLLGNDNDISKPNSAL